MNSVSRRKVRFHGKSGETFDSTPHDIRSRYHMSLPFGVWSFGVLMIRAFFVGQCHACRWVDRCIAKNARCLKSPGSCASGANCSVQFCKALEALWFFLSSKQESRNAKVEEGPKTLGGMASHHAARNNTKDLRRFHMSSWSAHIWWVWAKACLAASMFPLGMAPFIFPWQSCHGEPFEKPSRLPQSRAKCQSQKGYNSDLGGGMGGFDRGRWLRAKAKIPLKDKLLGQSGNSKISWKTCRRSAGNHPLECSRKPRLGGEVFRNLKTFDEWFNLLLWPSGRPQLWEVVLEGSASPTINGAHGRSLKMFVVPVCFCTFIGVTSLFRLVRGNTRNPVFLFGS